MRSRRLIVIGVHVVIFCSAAFSQNKVEVRVTTDRNKIAIGEELVYSLIIRYPNKVKLLGDPVTDFSKFEVTQIKKYEPAEDGGFRIEQYDYSLTTFTVDTFFIGAPRVPYRSGKDSLVAEGPTRSIIVASTIDSTVKDIRPEKPLIQAEINWWLLFLYVFGGALVLAALVYFGIKLYRKYKQGGMRKPVVEIEPVKTPEELALERLDALKDRQLIENGEFKEFHIEASNIIRMYVEQKFLIQALECTTSDLMVVFQRKKLAEENYVTLLRRFLEVCDLVKFAKYRPSSRECHQIMNDAYGLVKFMYVKNAEEAHVLRF